MIGKTIGWGCCRGRRGERILKYIVILGDGMADEPMDILGGKTPMECADTPTMDAMACAGRMGMVQNVPNGMAPGSDVANLSVLGYDPARSY